MAPRVSSAMRRKFFQNWGLGTWRPTMLKFRLTRLFFVFQPQFTQSRLFFLNYFYIRFSTHVLKNLTWNFSIIRRNDLRNSPTQLNSNNKGFKNRYPNYQYSNSFRKDPNWNKYVWHVVERSQHYESLTYLIGKNPWRKPQLDWWILINFSLSSCFSSFFLSPSPNVNFQFLKLTDFWIDPY